MVALQWERRGNQVLRLPPEAGYSALELVQLRRAVSQLRLAAQLLVPLLEQRLADLPALTLRDLLWWRFRRRVAWAD